MSIREDEEVTVRASVVVPVRNGESVIGRCLQALMDQDLPSSEYEVIVVDDGSSDGTTRVVGGFPSVRLIRQPPRGPAAARNRGISEARGDWVLFTDADCAPYPGWARHLLKAVCDRDAAGGKGVYVTRQRSLVARFVQVEYETKYRRMARRETIDFVDTYAAIYRRDVLQAVNGFDERLPTTSLEDQELSFRVAERGYRLVFVPEAVVEHLHADTLRGYARKKFAIGFWKVAVLAAHPGKAMDDSHTPQSLKIQIALTALVGLAVPVAILAQVWWVPLVPAAFLVASWVPFVSYALHRDVAVGLVAPALLLVRAMALGSGLTCGLLRLGRCRNTPL